ncbi:MAG: ROK family protein [Sarcina sp.]
MIACIDIGGTAIKVGVLNVEGNIVYRDSLEVDQNIDGFTKNLLHWVEEIRKSYEIKGIAISSPGAVDTKLGVVGGASAIPCIHGPNWKEILGEATGLPVSIENDANCAALAESFNGSGKSYRDVLFLVCGTGIGGAILREGRIHHGKHLHGGEFGYMIMEEKDGKFYNFSETSSTMSFVRKARAHYNDESYDGKRVFEEAAKGNEYCQEIIERFYLNLAKGIFNLQYVYDPELILIGGAISEREDFIDRLNEKIDYILKEVEIAKVKPLLGTCTHKADANLIGALANFLGEHKFES